MMFTKLRYILAAALWLPVAIQVSAKLPQSQLSALNLDYFVVEVTNPEAKVSSTLSLIIRDGGNTSDLYKSSDKDAILDGSANTTLGIYSKTVDAQGDDLLLTKDNRPYNKRLYVEFPLEFYASVAGDYKLTIREPVLLQTQVNVSAVFIQLIDSLSPSDVRYHTLWQMEGKKAHAYTFKLTAQASKSQRFKVRFYEANLLKTGSHPWNDATAWEGGFIPGTRPIDDALQVIIPPEGEVTIPQGNNITIGSLFDSGSVTVANGASLTTTEQCEIKIN